MSSQFSNIKRFTRLLVDEAVNTVRDSFRDDSRLTRPPELEKLEQRVLMSATPLAVVADVVPQADADVAAAQPTAVAAEEITPSDDQQSNETNIQATVELVVIDPAAENHEQLVSDLQSQTDRSFEILVLNPRADGIAQITDALESLSGVSAIHLVSHGDEGEILLGTSVLSQRSIDRYAAELVTWQGALTADADLLVYGCDLAASESGIELTTSLNLLLGTDVAASDDLTGHEDLGGDWDLEQQVGQIEASVAFSVGVQSEWQGLLTVASTDEFLVNETPGGIQETSNEDRGNAQSVAIAPNGEYVVVWSSNQATGDDGNGYGVLMRRFDANGNPLTGEIQVNTNFTGDQHHASVSVDDTGRGVVVWTDENAGGIRARLFDATGALDGGEIDVNNTTGGDQDSPSVAMQGDGAFVVAWEGNGPGDNAGIFYRRFTAAGTPVEATDQRANSDDLGAEADPSVAVNDAGQFVVAWESNTEIYVRHFHNTGVAVHTDVEVDNTAGDAHAPAVAIDSSGRSVVVYRSDGANFAGGIGAGSWGKAFNHDGSVRHSFFQLSDAGFTTDNTDPAIAMDDAGNFVVVFHGDDNGDGTGSSVKVRLYNANTSAISEASVVNQSVSDDQYKAAVALQDVENFVVVWSGKGDQSGEEDADGGVFARQYHLIAPVLDLDADNSSGSTGADFNANFDDGSGPVAVVDADAVLTDANDADLQSLVVTITDRQDGGDEVLAADVSGTSITANYSTFSGKLTLSGADTVANYQQVLRTITYDNGQNPATGTTRTLTFVANDGLVASNVGTTTMSINGVFAAQLTAVADTYIDKGAKDDNFGNSGSIIVDEGGGGLGDGHGLIQFDVSTLPVGATITGATLQLEATAITGGTIVEVHEVTEAWTEGTQSGSAGVASWDDRQSGIGWTTPGGSIDATVIDSINATATGTHTWDVTSLAQAWHTGAKINNGLLLLGPNSGNDFVTYDSREGTNVPQLVVTYTISGNSIPTAHAGGPYTINEGDSLSLVGSASSDPDTDPLTYRWDLDNDGNFGETDEQTTETASVSWSVLQAFGIDDDGIYTIGVQVDDGNGGIDTATTTVTVNNVNPAATADSGTGFIRNEDTSFTTASVLTNDTDANSVDVLSVTALDTTGTVGLVTDNGDGTFDYDPNGQFESLAVGQQATDTFSYTVSDDDGGSSSATVTITINGRNDAPVIESSQVFGVSETVANSTRVGTVRANDVDSGTTFSSWSITDGDPNGVFAIDSSTGELSVADNATLDYSTTSSYTLSLTVSDGDTVSAVDTIVVNVEKAAEIAETETAVVIDGVIDSLWTSVDNNTLNNLNIGTIDATNDLAATWKSVWDDNNLYFLVTVTDDTLVRDSGANFHDDLVELYIDADGSGGTSYDGVNDFEYAFRYNDPGAVHVGANSVQDATGVSFQLTPNGAGYVLEVSVPWSTLGVTPTDANAIGVDVHVTDDDDGGNRDTKIAWNDSTDQAYRDPSTFGSATLRATPNNAPTAAIAALSTIAEGGGLNLDGSTSSDPDDDTLTYQWDLNYDGVTFGSDRAGATPSLDWAALTASGINDNGTYQIALRVHDGTEYSAIAETTLTVTNTTPDISVSGLSETGSLQTYTLSLSATDPGDDTISQWTINWGDGLVDVIPGNPTSVTHTYTNDGFTNNILVSATDEDGTHLESKLFVTSYSSNALFSSDGQTTTSNSTSTSPADVVVGPDGFLYVANLSTGNITRHDPASGAFVSNFVFATSGGLNQPSRIAFGPDGDLFVTSRANDRVLRYSGKDGRFLETFLDAADGLSTPDGIAFGRDGFLYVANQATGDILKFNAKTGAAAGTLATFGGAGNIDLQIDSNGKVFASHSTTNVIREFNGATGATVRDLVTAATGQMTMIGGFAFGPDGRLYVADIAADRVVQYESNGTYIGDYISPAAGLDQPIDLAFSASHQVKVNATPVTETDTYTVAEGGTFTGSVVNGWASPSWKQRQELIFDNGGGPALTDVPVLVKLHATAADAINIDYSKTQDGGEDIRFADTDGTLLSHQIESWDESGYSYVWVKVPQIDAGSASDSITMYFDNPHAPDGSSRTAAWNTDDVAVIHFNGSTLDSSAAGNDGANTSTAVATGITAGAASFNGTNSSVNLGTDSSVDDIFAGGGTVSAWINPSSWGQGDYGRIADKASTTFGGSSNGDGWAFQVAGAGAKGYLIFEHGFTTAHGEWRTPSGTPTTAGSLSLNTWQHVSVVYNSDTPGTPPEIYINGILQTLDQRKTPDGTARSDAALNLVIGNHSAASTRTFDGLIDEVRVSSESTSGAEIALQVASVNGTLLTIGTVEAGPGGVLANDYDPEGDALTVSVKRAPDNFASFSLNPDGSFTYVHDGTNTTSDSFEYYVTDGLTTSSGTVLLTITSDNDVPTISSISNLNLNEDQPSGTIGFTIDDQETAVNLLTVSASSNNQSIITDSSLVLGGTGANRTLSFTPVANASGGPVTITVSVSDGVNTTTTTFEVTVAPQNDVPTISAIADVSTPEDTSVGPISFTVDDVESAASTLVVTATSDNQSLIADGDIILGGTDATRTISFSPVAHAHGGPATITVNVFDGTNTTSTTFEVTVSPQNDAPTISAIADVSTPEDTPLGPINFTIGDVETTPGGLIVTATSDNQGLIADSDIALSGTGANRQISFSPVSNSHGGPATITLNVSDGTTTTSTTFEVTVSPQNDEPTVSTIADVSTPEDTPVGPISFTIGDVETATNALVVTATSDNQSVVADGDILLGGTGANRTMSFLPVANATGGPVTISVDVSDGTTTTTQTFEVTVTAQNDAPTVSAISDISSPEDTPVGPISFTVGDVDNAPGSLTVTATSSDQSLIADGDITIGGSGDNRTISFVPVTNATGGPATITVRVSDGTAVSTSTFDVTLTSSADAPTVTSISDVSIQEDSAAGPFAFTIGDPDTPVTSLVITAASSNQALIADADIIIGGTGASRDIRFTTLPNATGASNITITVSDGAVSTTTTFAVTVTPVNDAPTLSPIADVTSAEDTPVSPIAFTVGDSETATGSLVVTATSDNQALVADADIVIGGSGANRTISFTPAANAIGSTTVTVTVSDGTTTTSTAFNYTATAVNDAPTIAGIASQTVAEDSQLGPIAVTIGDVDDSVGSLILTATSSDQSLIADADIVVSGTDANRELRLTPAANAFGGPATITLSVSDGTTISSTTFDVTISAANDIPVISKILDVTMDEDTTSAPIGFMISDTETAAAGLTVTAVSSDQDIIKNNSIEILGTGANRALRITPNSNASGGPVMITVSVSDGSAATTESFEITVTPDNDAPTISHIGNGSTTEDTPTPPINFVIGDSDTPLSALTVTATSSDQTLFADSDLVVAGTGANRTLTITPVANATGGPATITLTVSDGVTSTSTSFTGSVVATNDVPQISAIADVVSEEDAVISPITFSIGDIDSPLSDLTVAATSSDQAVIKDDQIVLNGTGENRTITLTPEANVFGATTISIVVSDGSASTTRKFDVNVTPVNDLPEFSAIADSASAEDQLAGPIRFTVSDVDNNNSELTVTATSSDQSLIADGNIQVLGTGKNRRVRFAPETDANGTATITLTLSDGIGTTQHTFVAEVTPVNDAPQIAEGQKRVYELSTNEAFVAATPGLLAGASDIENDALSVHATKPENGSLLLNEDGSFVYTPDIGFSGTDRFRFTVSDGDLHTAPELVKLIVPVVASAPVTSSVGSESNTSTADTIQESETTPSTEPTAETNGGESSDSGTAAILAPTGLDDREDDDEGYVPPTISNGDDDNDTAQVLIQADETATIHDGFVFANQDGIVSAQSERVHASVLRSLEYADFSEGLHNAPVEIATVTPTRTFVQFSYERYAELKGTVEQIDDLEEQLESSSAAAEFAETFVTVTGTGIVIGSVITAVQTGMLALGFISQLPAWTLFDPLMVMDGVSGSDDGDSLQDIVDRQNMDETPPNKTA